MVRFFCRLVEPPLIIDRSVFMEDSPFCFYDEFSLIQLSFEIAALCHICDRRFHPASLARPVDDGDLVLIQRCRALRRERVAPALGPIAMDGAYLRTAYK